MFLIKPAVFQSAKRSELCLGKPKGFTEINNINIYMSENLDTYYNVFTNDNIYIDMQAGRNLLPKLPVADN